jgi:hypothetical protein
MGWGGPFAHLNHHSGIASEAHVLATFGARADMSVDIPAASSGHKGDKTVNKTQAASTPLPGPIVVASFGRRSPYVEGVKCENSKDREARLKYLKAQITAQVGMSSSLYLDPMALMINIRDTRCQMEERPPLSLEEYGRGACQGRRDDLQLA